jgi:2-polyprenyl-3-methyl-5-hydroxy-6-metoxy-1,4-benzoquinol methylase
VTHEEHYKTHLSRFYTWMFGDFDTMVETQAAFFERHSIAPSSSGVALDLGSGPGFQSIALSRLGFGVLAVDTSEELLRELKARESRVQVYARDFRDLSFVRESRPELIVCMGDTLTHLGSLGEVRSVIGQAFDLLVPKGRLILTFRDLSVPRLGVDRFIAVRSDAERILTCFLEDDGESVIVSDILHEKNGTEWDLSKSSYRKIKLSLAAASALASEAGFRVASEQLRSGMNVVIGRKD